MSLVPAQPPPPTRTTYAPDDWAWRYVGGLLAEEIAFGASLVPLPVAARRPVTLLPAKWGITRVPFAADLPPHPPGIVQLRGVSPRVGSVLDVFDAAARGRVDRAADAALALFVAGFVSPPGGSGAVVWVLPVWRADPATGVA